jgi:hypothetical protein
MRFNTRKHSAEYRSHISINISSFILCSYHINVGGNRYRLDEDPCGDNSGMKHTVLGFCLPFYIRRRFLHLSLIPLMKDLFAPLQTCSSHSARVFFCSWVRYAAASCWSPTWFPSTLNVSSYIIPSGTLCRISEAWPYKTVRMCMSSTRVPVHSAPRWLLSLWVFNFSWPVSTITEFLLISTSICFIFKV